MHDAWKRTLVHGMYYGCHIAMVVLLELEINHPRVAKAINKRLCDYGDSETCIGWMMWLLCGLRNVELVDDITFVYLYVVSRILETVGVDLHE